LHFVFVCLLYQSDDQIKIINIHAYPKGLSGQFYVSSGTLNPTNCLPGCLPGWLAAWLPACLAAYLPAWLAGCLPACLAGLLTNFSGPKLLNNHE